MKEINNNLEYARNQLNKACRDPKTRQGLTKGFEYATQKDSSVLAERLWRDLRRKSHTCFQLYKPSSDASRQYARSRSNPSVSLQRVDQKAQLRAQQYQRQQNLPPEPPKISPPKPPQPSLQNTAPRHDETSSLDQKTNTNEPIILCDDSISPVNSDPSSQPKFLSPPGRIRNRHNAVYGKFLPNAQNSPGYAAKVFGAESVRREERQRCRAVLSPQPEGFDSPEEDLDALFASVDVDQIVSTRQQCSMSSTLSATTTKTTHAGSGRSSSDSYGGGRSMSDSFQHLTSRSSSMTTDFYSPENPFQNNNYSTEGHLKAVPAPVPSHNEGSIHTDFYGDDDPPFGGPSPVFSSGPSPTFSGPISTRSMPSSHEEGHSAFFSASSALHTSSSGDADRNAVVCSGHGMPCQRLTARSSKNNGREFYKCPLQNGEQCDFFQWVDGMEGNWNADFDGGSPAVSGDVKDMTAENRRIFGHQNFRCGQKDIIHNAIQGRDVFVLMPTGGGKSLCYQLPAWCCPGVTVVISPLLSLIQDQVQSMTKLGVDAVYLASSQDYNTEQVEITQRLRDAGPHGGIKLLYITPEKLTNSNQIQYIIRSLYHKKLLSRFVVDEAHCLSDWGHDFRPDYMRLDCLRRDFPSVPLMALTATANDKVVRDAIQNLGMRNEFLYKSSFNRPNLHYEVRKKSSKTVDEIAEYIAKKPNDSGVIYCLSRKDCEKTSDALQKKLLQKPNCRNVRVSFYHAELDSHERARRHREWSNGRISVLCATVAFGMGIDKPDVRYVIHYSMPKSITHYYQESGRAGRDGEQADCILYYQYKDKSILENLIMKGANDPYGQAARRQVDQLYTCVRYCEDSFRCRRTMQLEFFGEHFERGNCLKTCDNCRAERVPDRRNMTSVAKDLLQLLADLQLQKKKGVTLNQLTEVYRGSKSQQIVKFLNTSALKGYGQGKSFKKYEVDRIAHSMIFERLLIETSIQNQQGFASDYVQMGENAAAVQMGRTQFFVDFPRDAPRATGKENNSSREQENKNKKATPTRKKAPKTSSKKAATSKKSPNPGDVVIVESESDDEELLAPSAFSSDKKKGGSKSVLPHDHCQKLLGVVKKLVTNWAEEERLLGKNVFYWNIMSNLAMRTIAEQAPTTVEDIKAMGILGENVIKEYGERLVKAVATYVTAQGLDEYLARRPAKRAKTTNETIAAPAKPQPCIVLDTDDSEEDEFGFGAIDLSAVDLDVA